MIILDKPYVSDYLLKTILSEKLPVLRNSFTESLPELAAHLIVDSEFVERIKTGSTMRFYSTTENAIGWIAEHLAFLDLPQQIDVFKDKVKFRELIQSIYPDFIYQKVTIDELDELDISSFPFPFIIKPSVGFFSMGVYRVDSMSDWKRKKVKLLKEIQDAGSIYPKEVFNGTSFIIEEFIEGDEYAFDAYFNESGNPVVLNAYKHFFADEDDVSDRVYFTSKQILAEKIPVFTDFLQKMGKLISVKNFPIHVEVRISEDQQLIPIEANPFRFGGWCTTADMTQQALGFNPYHYYLKSIKPDWNEIFSKMNDSFYSIVVLNNSTGVDGKNIESFDYESLNQHFTRILELRKVDFKAYPVFGFLFTETPSDSFAELENIAKSSLKEFIKNLI